MCGLGYKFDREFDGWGQILNRMDCPKRYS